MKTLVQSELLPEMGQALQQGEAVAFPTETVYGLGASALSEEAVRHLYELKGRPLDNPLIVHIPDLSWLERVALDIPDLARQLFLTFAPGPLTLVLKRNPAIPALVSAGLDTVAVRIPENEKARALIRAAGVPLVAPSANRSGRPSPTTAAHVLQDFSGRIPFILDDGPTPIGIESTVLDLTVEPPVILRPGRITADDLASRAGLLVDQGRGDSQKSPGQRHRHYAPDVPLQVVQGLEALLEAVTEAPHPVGVFCSTATKEQLVERLGGERQDLVVWATYEGATEAGAAARALYAALRRLEAAGVCRMVSESLPATGQGKAFMDRLRRAAEPERLIVFVCTGNTCRSPMAERLFNDLAPAGWKALSLGLAAVDGQPLSPGAAAALRKRGLALPQHRAGRLDADLLARADAILTMTKAQADWLSRLLPDLEERVRPLCPDRDIADPFGGDAASYERAAAEIAQGIVAFLAGLSR